MKAILQGQEAWRIPMKMISNPNLLINADFRKPVNRNGKPEYTSNGYTIDGWYARNISVELQNDGIHIVGSAGNAAKAFNQRIQNPSFFLGKTVTASVLLDNPNNVPLRIGIVFADSVTVNSNATGHYITSANGLVSLTVNIPDSMQGYSGMNFEIFCNNASSMVGVVLKAVKLELGPVQTLAHQDADGKWVLNDPPDYDMQYALCSQYNPITGEWIGYQRRNPNLLIDWYFADPVNQKKQKAYLTQWTYSIDCWLLPGSATITLHDGYASIVGAIDQAFESLPSGTYTVSILFANGTLQFATLDFDANNKVGSWSSIGGLVYYNNRWALRLQPSPSAQFDVIAVKMELGDKQTLARQGADGKWVLSDPPPDKALELAKCQRYMRVYDMTNYIANGYISGGSKRAIVAIPDYSDMRKKPAVVFSDLTATIRTNAGYSPNASYTEPGTVTGIDIGSSDHLTISFGDSELGDNNMPISVQFRSGQLILDANS